MRTYIDTLARGDVQGESAMMMAYGLYLLNGGRPSDFSDLTPDDVQVMVATYFGLQARQADAIARRIWPSEEQ